MNVSMACICSGLCLCLAACHAPSFETPPMAEVVCDPALTGDWVLTTNVGQEDDVAFSIDGKCLLRGIEQANGAAREVQIQIHVGKDVDSGYLWFDAVRLPCIEDSLPADDVYLVRYRVAGALMMVELPDMDRIAHWIIDGRLGGEVRYKRSGPGRAGSAHLCVPPLDRYIGMSKAVRVLAPVDPGMLGEPDFFMRDDVLSFRRKSRPT